MARFSQVLTIPEWAKDGERTLPDAANFANAVNSREEGLDQSFSQVGGKRPDYTIFNELVYEMTAFFNLMNRIGLPMFWSAEIDYVDPAFVKGSDGRVYISVEDSGPSTADAINPTADTREAKWKLY